VPPQTTPLQDQIANISPVYVVLVVMALTIVRLVIAKNKEGWARTTSEICDTINFVLIVAFLIIKPFVAQAFYIPSESMERTLLVGDRLIVNKFSYRFQQPHRGDVVVFEAPPAATGGVESGQDYIKRLIGEPNDTVEVRAPKLLINGESPAELEGEGTGVHAFLRDKLSLGMDDAVKIFPDYVLVNGTERITKEVVAEKLGQPGAKIELEPGKVLVNDKVLEDVYTREDPSYDMPSKKLGPDQFFMMGDNRNHSADSHIWGPLDKDRVVGKAVFVFFPPSRMGVIR
jgi:signal peptidase I